MDTAILRRDPTALLPLLREVREEGRSFVVTATQARGRSCPVTAARRRAGAARAELLARLSAQPVVDVGRWNRDDLYER